MFQISERRARGRRRSQSVVLQELTPTESAWSSRSERGSAVVEYVLLLGLVLTVVAALAQIIVALHARNVVQDAAHDAARIAAYADGTDALASDRAHLVLARSLGAEFAAQSRVTVAIDAEISRATVTSPIPALGFRGRLGTQAHTSSAMTENRDGR